MDIAAFFSAQSLAVLGEVIMIDLVLAGDNAVVVGSLAAGLPRDQQQRVILIGIVAALVLRIGFALVATLAAAVRRRARRRRAAAAVGRVEDVARAAAIAAERTAQGRRVGQELRPRGAARSRSPTSA